MKESTLQTFLRDRQLWKTGSEYSGQFRFGDPIAVKNQVIISLVALPAANAPRDDDARLRPIRQVAEIEALWGACE